MFLGGPVHHRCTGPLFLSRHLLRSGSSETNDGESQSYTILARLINPSVMTRLLFVLCFFLITLCTSVRAQGDWTVSDIINQEGMSSVSFSPDGQMLLWSKRRAVKKKDRFVRDLYLTRLNVKKENTFLTTRLTRTDDNDYSARFSRDGDNVYFLSSREKGNKLWRLSIYGGEAEQVHEFKNGISSPDWLNDSTLVF